MLHEDACKRLSFSGALGRALDSVGMKVRKNWHRLIVIEEKPDAVGRERRARWG